MNFKNKNEIEINNLLFNLEKDKSKIIDCDYKEFVNQAKKLKNYPIYYFAEKYLKNNLDTPIDDLLYFYKIIEERMDQILTFNNDEKLNDDMKLLIKKIKKIKKIFKNIKLEDREYSLHILYDINLILINTEQLL